MNKFSITFSSAGKRFNREWIFKNLNATFLSGKAYAITGPNGSGKSTLLQCLAGSIQLNSGSVLIQHSSEEKSFEISPENLYQYISVCAPYLELVEEMTALELLVFHQQFKDLRSGLTVTNILNEIGLSKAGNKQIRHYSSGMKQRIKLAQAIFADTPILLLDEPCTNLDKDGYALYHQLINRYCQEKLVIICSNEEAEINFCKDRLNIVDYK